ncbi:MAG TPA: glycoside hydrolase family 15 protein, partial [Acidimicrobiia bacterium]|nr:glycoside hydrolase family 15 protein [Acidimicrobiia bacterium]
MDDLPRLHALRQYALLADGERGGIVGPDGAVVWLCFPRWHDDAIFGALVGASGSYTVTPQDRFVWGGYYEEGTLIWRSRWVTNHGVIECREALAAPASADRAVLLRRVVVREGRGAVRVRLEPATNFGRHHLRHLDQRDGVWTGIAGDVHVRWSGAGDVEVERSRRASALTTRLALREGQHHDFVLELSCDAPSDPPPVAEREWERTEQFWAHEVPPLEHVEPARDVRHAVVVLRGLTSSSGGTVAAATTSLPERAEAGRNYDYRYVWIRDLCLTGLAYDAAGLATPLERAVAFVQARLLADGPATPPASTVEGAPVPGQRSLSLPGYPGGQDFVGNHVNEQFQLDAFGQSLLLFAAAARRDRLDPDGWRAVDVAVDTIKRRGDEPDSGIWELSPARW